MRTEKRWRNRRGSQIKKQEWYEWYHFASLQELEFKLLHTELSSSPQAENFAVLSSIRIIWYRLVSHARSRSLHYAAPMSKWRSEKGKNYFRWLNNGNLNVETLIYTFVFAAQKAEANHNPRRCLPQSRPYNLHSHQLPEHQDNTHCCLIAGPHTAAGRACALWLGELCLIRAQLTCKRFYEMGCLFGSVLSVD